MATFRVFAYNTGTTISGTEQVGSIAINSGTTLSGNVVWWAGPDQDLGYVVAESVPSGTMTGANGQPAYLGFYRSTELTSSSFISLANYLAQGQQVFTDGTTAKTWLNNNGYWTSYVTDFLQFISTNISGYFGIGLSQMGFLYGWGSNTAGQLGINSTQSKFTPVAVSGAKKTFCKIATGASYSFAIDKYGQLWSWGSNTYGQLANRSQTSYSTPRSISGAKKTFCHVTAWFSPQFAGALDIYGQAWAWGEGTGGVLGNNEVSVRCTPVSVCGAKKTFCQIAANSGLMHALDQYGQIWNWGSGASGGLGNNSVVSYSTPVSLCGAKKTFCQLTAGAAIDKYGQIWCWGSNFGGFLGNNSITDTSTPVSICGARKTFCQLTSFNSARGAIDIYGRLWVWGTSSDYLIASSTSTPKLIVGATKTFCKVFGGGRPGFAQTYNQVNWSWGSNEYGVRAINFAMPNLTPISICGVRKTFCEINLKNVNVLGLTQSGKLYAWGSNFDGALGTNDSLTVCRLTPVGVYNFATKTYCQVTTASSNSYAIDETGLVWSWGANTLGQLGINSTVSRCTPGSILGVRKTICKIDAGSSFILSIDKNGLIWGWGQGIFGKLGIGTPSNKSTPVSICGALKTFCHVAASTSNGYGIDVYGRIWSWGSASQGQLGNNQIATQANTPISICGANKTFCKISAGGNVVMAIDKYGQIWGWGSNNAGQLADNSVTARSTPVSICGAKKTFCNVFVSNLTVMAVDKYGKIWVWGDNTYGSFGNNTIGFANNKSTPVSISGAVKTFCRVTTTNERGSLAIDKNGLIWSWGQDYVGQLGHNYTFLTPMTICNI